ncbi:sugar ABC transporter ATP-binding protein [Rhizobium sp. CC-YZS058]|uniref:sugar ABC transporter ATP-binding protein n=1 Tax=Rhizobium sp. CC-YZS058 TaxID=3042153 RepID=UPI002B0528DE|nr:sugar ABC transporter ATP-binding protein [Rhizobium sp. CC-YZS058]MEA3537398.1 sugar ABC transporter ATP-binding protein [Rhizobium sp. CC-YZS058]
MIHSASAPSHNPDVTAIAALSSCTKRYPGVLALDKASFRVEPGEVRALLGKNGAGKSTLIRLLTGAEVPDSGAVSIGGVALSGSGSARAQDAFSRGVRVVYQELSLVPGMSIAENLFLGRWPRRAGVLDYAGMEQEARDAMRRLGLTMSPADLVAGLSPAERQLVEIARVLLGKPKLVILDEPTSSLAAAEAEKVMAAVKRIAAEGIAVIYISHRMNEIRQIARSATVMRDGRIIDTVDVAGADTREIVRLMLGSEAAQAARIEPKTREKIVLAVEDLTLPPKLDRISFALRQGEVLGIAGLLGAGRTELLQAIMGVRPFESGRISVDGADLRRPSYRAMLERGFGYTPESRKEEGIVPLLGVDENTVATDFAAVSHRGILSARRIAEATRSVIGRLHVKTAATDTPIGTLSGGNQQKVVIGRWVHAGSRVLLLDEPTRGVDVEAKAQIYAIIRQLAAEGRSVIFVSSEIEELPLVCDRVLVLRDGRLTDEFLSPAIDQDAVMAACIAGH